MFSLAATGPEGYILISDERQLPARRQSRTCGVVLASGHESADHQLVDAHLFLRSLDGESAVQAFAQT